MAGFPGGAEVKVSVCNVGDLVRSLGREDPLEKEMATHCSILAWRIPCMEELGGLQSTGRRESDTTERLHFTSLEEAKPLFPQNQVMVQLCHARGQQPN